MDQLRPIPLVTPGFKGLNSAQASVPDLDPGWATSFQNFIFDQSGRIAARNGWLNQTATPLSGTPAIQSMFEFVTSTGTSFIISAANNKLYQGTGTLTDITGSLTVTANNWQFFSFNGAVYGVQAGHPLITWSGSGNFIAAPGSVAKTVTGSMSGTTLTVTATLTGNPLQQGDIVTGASVPNNTQILQQLTFTSSSGGGPGTYQVSQSATVGSETLTVATIAVPTGCVAGMAAFGRLWLVNSDFQTVSYCALLDATTWYANSLSFNGAGSFNTANVWTRGIDSIQAIAAAGAKMVVFGLKQIIVYYDTNNPVIGLNPQNLCVYDTIEGTGCVARDTVQSTGEGDLTFLSPTGIQSFQRLLTSGRDNPVTPLDPQVRDYVNSYFVNETPAQVRSVYSPTNRFYMLLFPTSQRAFVYDTRFPLPAGPINLAGALRCVEWPGITFTSMCSQRNGNLLLGQAGCIGLYTGYSDNGNSYGVVFVSPWLALAPQLENIKKVLKYMKAVLYYSGNQTVNFQWGVDFTGLTNTYQIPLTGSISEYNVAQYAINEYGGGAGTVIAKFPLSLSGRWLQFGMSATINGFQLALQQLDAFAKAGVMD